MKTSTITTLLAAVSAVQAATVTLKETDCIQKNTELETFTITLDELAVKELKSVCGLEIVSASGVDVNSISCQAYADAEGTHKGSAEFTFSDPALIATNPVQEGSIKCKVSSNSSSSSTASSAAPSTIITTATAAGSTASGSVIPTSGGNVTSPTGTHSPTGPSTTGTAGAPQSSGGAGQVGLSIGAIGAAFAALLL